MDLETALRGETKEEKRLKKIESDVNFLIGAVVLLFIMVAILIIRVAFGS